MPPRRAARSVSRRDTPLSPPKVTRDDPTVRQTRRSTRSASYDSDRDHVQSKIPVVQLQNIEEEEHDSEDRNEIEGDDADASSGASSSYSLDSDYELETLDREAVIDNLSDLYHDASKLLEVLTRTDSETSSGLHHELRIDPAIKKRALASFRRFAISREAYDSRRLYIKPSIIVKKILAGQIQQGINDGRWRPDAILYLANLAQFLTTITLGEDDEINETLGHMFNTFPKPLCAIGSSTANRFTTTHGHETFTLQLAIRTQSFIRSCENQLASPDFDPDEMLKEVFLSEEAAPAGTEFEDANHEAATAEHITQIRQFFTIDSRDPIDLRGLHGLFPWSDFISQVAEWAALRREELENAIEGQAGVTEIIDRIQAGDWEDTPVGFPKDKIQQPASKPDSTPQSILPVTQTEEQASNKKQMSKPPSKSQLQKTMARFKDIKAASAARQSGATRVPLAEIVPERLETVSIPPPGKEITHANSRSDDPILGDGFDHPVSTQTSIVPTYQTSVVLGVLKAQAKQSKKENIPKPTESSLDAQESATMESSEGHKDEQDKQWPKRRREIQEDESDEDDFEEDTRALKRSRIEQARSSTKMGKQPRRHLGGESPGSEEEEKQAQEEAGENEVQQQRPRKSTSPQHLRNISSTQPARASAAPRTMLPLPSSTPPPAPPPITAPSESQRTATPVARSTQSPKPASHRSSKPPSTLPASSQAATINARAKFAVRTAKLNNFDQQPQVRKPYSAEEIDRLIELTALKGTKWAEMLITDADWNSFPGGPKLQNRTQVQLKDKARNIKLDYLKAGQGLPPGFQFVSIGSKMVEMLKSMGIIYREGDVRGHRS